MLSPNSFHDGINTSPVTHNSCPASWGVIDHTDGTQITCVGSLAPSGTGPFRFVSRSTNDEGNDDVVVFQQHVDYWAGAPDIEYLHIVRHETSAEVKDALLAGEIDAVLGAGVLEPQDLQDFLYDDAFEVLHSEPTQNTVLIMNIDDIQLRKVVVHAVNKAAIVERELGGIEEPVSQLFPESAPYCDVDLLPKFDYDYEKATLLFCGDGSSSKKSKKSSADTLFIVLFVIALVAAILLVLGVCFMVRKERKGEPLFSPLTNPLYDDADEVQLPKIKEEKDLSQESKSSQNNV